MKGNLEKISQGQLYPGQTCVYCEDAIDSQDEVVVCPRCRSIHHVECWRDKGGCGKTGCPQVAQAIKGERPPGDGPPPPVSKKVIIASVLGVLAVILLMVFWPKPPDPALGRTKVVVMGEAYYELSESMTQLAENFNATSEDIYIELQLLPAGGMDAKLVVLIAANEAPDVIALDEDRFAYFSAEGVLLPLGEDESGDVIYGMEHPAQLSQMVIWGATRNPEAALEVLHYFVANIPPVEKEILEGLKSPPLMFGY